MSSNSNNAQPAKRKQAKGTPKRKRQPKKRPAKAATVMSRRPRLSSAPLQSTNSKDPMRPQEDGQFQMKRTAVRYSQRSLTENYMRCLASPKDVMSRIPDAYSRPTALVRSVQIFDLVVNTDPAVPNFGRFSVAVQPFLGDLGNVNNYCTLVVDNTMAWPADMSQPAAYLKVVNGVDPRIDPFFDTLTQPVPSLLALQNGGAAPFGIPLGLIPVARPPYSYGLNFTYSVNVPTGTSIVQLPPGQYQFVFRAVPTAAQHIDFSATAGSQLILDQNDDSVAGSLINFANGWITIGPQADGSSGGLIISGGTTIAFTAALLNFSPIFTPSLSVLASAGLITQYRPVAMSLKFTSSMSQLVDGGMVATAWVPGDTFQANYVNTQPTSSVGPLQMYENVAKLDRSYNGRMQYGTYAAYMPEDNLDISFLSPQNALNNAYPALVCSGLLNLSGSAPGPGSKATIGRFEVWRVFEVEINSTLLESLSCCGSTKAVEDAWLPFSKRPITMQNDQHNDWLKDIFGIAEKFLPFIL